MTNALSVRGLPDAELARNAVALAAEARHRLAKIANPVEAAKFVHDLAAIKQRIHKLRLAKEEAYEAAFPWDMAWLEGMRHTGGLLTRGQEAGTIALGGRRGSELGNKLLLNDLEIERIESSRWQRLASIDAEDWRVFDEEFYAARREPTLTAALRLADTGTVDLDRPWLRLYQVWNFQMPDPAFGLNHPGRIPGQIMQNLNYYYTKPGDLIVDPFAGGGSTLDVCVAHDDDYGNRKCLAFDIEPIRKDIKVWDIVAAGLPPFPRARMIFLDPPYWKQKQGEYSAHETNMANLPLERFHDELERVIKESRKRADLVALIIGPTQENWEIIDHAAEMMHRIGAPWKRIQVPYSTQQHGGNYVQMAKEAKQWLYLARDLMLWKA